jgi:hypothetical protein
MSRADYLHKDAAFRLTMAAKVINDAYPESYGCYVVGSVLERPDYRDVDVRCIMPDDEFDRHFPGVHDRNTTREPWHPRFSLLCFSITAWLRHMTDLPIDFQFQRQTQANEKYKGRRRNAIGNGLVSAPDAA